MPKKDYYNILGVTEDADEQTIRKAYKKLALKWHPDRNLDNKLECEEKFKEIAEAYEVLSDPKKKHAYDHGGVDELYHDYGTHFMHDPFEMFDRLFENFGFINLHRSHKRRNSFFDDPFFNIDMTFGDFSLFDSPNTSTFTSISSFGGDSHSNRGHFTSTSIQTSIINGKKITTKKINQNGKEIIEKYENGELIEKYIDGVSQKHQAIGYQHHISAEKNHHNHQSHHNNHCHQQHQSHLEQFLQEEEDNEKELQQQQFERRKKKIFGHSHHSNSYSRHQYSHSHSHSHSQPESKIKTQQNNNDYHHQKHYNQPPKYSSDVKQFLQEDDDDSN